MLILGRIPYSAKDPPPPPGLGLKKFGVETCRIPSPPMKIWSGLGTLNFRLVQNDLCGGSWCVETPTDTI